MTAQPHNRPMTFLYRNETAITLRHNTTCHAPALQRNLQTDAQLRGCIRQHPREI